MAYAHPGELRIAAPAARPRPCPDATPVEADAGVRSPDRAGRWAVLVWLGCLPAAFLAPDLLGLSPFSALGAAVPLGVGALLLAAVLALWRRRRTGAIAGIATGALAGWVLFALRAGLHGTPYPFFAGDDTVRLSAMAERYTTTLHSADGIVGGVPSDYPPLFPWVVGRLSVLLGIPAWRLVAPVEVILASAVLVAGFLLWRRLVSDWRAFAVAVTTFAAFLTPAKAYEWMALEVIIPWVLATFVADHGRPRLHWLAAGVIGGLQVLLYQGYLMFFALGIAALVVRGVRRSPDPRGYAVHVLRVCLVGLAVAAWYLVPLGGWAVSHGLQMTDRYRDPLITQTPWDVLAIGPLGLLEVIGIGGLVRYRGRSWWAIPLLWLLASAYAFRVYGETEYRRTGQTLVFQYTIHVVVAALIVAGVLTVTTAAPALLRRVPRMRGRLGALALALVVAWVGTMGWSEWIPAAPALEGFRLPALPNTGSAPADSFLVALPDGRYPRFAPSRRRLAWFPTDPVIADVRSVLGPRATPLTLSCSELLFATEPWPGFIGVGANAAASTEHWFSRLQTLEGLSGIIDPALFARVSADTPWGAIDVFVLQADGPTWNWTPMNYPAKVRFRPAQFASRAFVVFHLPGGVELAVRRPADQRKGTVTGPGRRV